ncbi:hypothetical protein Tco_1418859 [Tanacetum coccineum]
MKDLVANKPKTEEDDEVRMNPRCSALLQNQLPPKEQDLGSFILPCSIERLDINHALDDLGDNTKYTPKGIVENLLVKIDKFIFPVDFFILDMIEDFKMPIILGRPLLATTHAKVDIFRKSISLKAGNERVIFKMRHSFVNTPVESESYEEVVYRMTEQEDLWKIGKMDKSNMKRHQDLTPMGKPKVHWCKAISQEKESGHEILKDYWKERFSDDEDNMDPPVKTDESEECKDPEECGEDEANTIIGVVLDKLNDDWFNGTNEDGDDLDRIIDYLEPTSYIKVSILEIDELPRTKDNVATVRPRLMEEMDKEGGALRKTGYEVAQVKLGKSSSLAITIQSIEQCSGESLVLILLLFLNFYFLKCTIGIMYKPSEGVGV